MSAPLTFDCPRCYTRVDEEFYGPCTPCIANLRDTQGLNKTDVVAEAYVPKMNVTPNAVALKE